MLASLLPHDVEMFGRAGVAEDLLARAGVLRVTNTEAREEYGITASGDCAGILFPYFDPITGIRHTCRLRRDNPDLDNGKVRGKYLCPYADKRHLYFVRGCTDLLYDASAPVLLVEAEKATLALTAWSERARHKLLPVGMGGCWGWRGRIGKLVGPTGHSIDEKGALPELTRVCFQGRQVFVLLDSNAETSLDVRAARAQLCRELLRYSARVSIASIPQFEGVNGPDDMIAKAGDSAIATILQLATPASELAIADSEALIDKIKNARPNADPEDLRRALDTINDVTDDIQRQLLQSRLADAVKGVVPKKFVIDELTERRKERRHRQEEKASENRRAELLSRPLNATALVDHLESFFSERAYLPNGAALLFAYFVLNTWVFDIFDATPYICLESAVPRCGKSTVIQLIDALSSKAMVVMSLNEAFFRFIHQQRPTLCIDEAELLEGRTDRAKDLRAILNQGYKRGGRVPRCVGEQHDEVKLFEVYCPKVFAAIGGVTGPLLDRCIVVHMERAPKGSKRKSTRIRAVARDRQPLVAQLEAYAVQCRDELQRLYDAEPDEGYWPQILDREAELWGPLLLHARTIGAAAESRLLNVVQQFSKAKDQIEAQDIHTAKALALLDALKKLERESFTPADLVEELSKSDAWTYTFSNAKCADEKTRERTKAVAVGFALRHFRLRPLKKSSSGSSVYDLQQAVAVISAHVPENIPALPFIPPANLECPQATENSGRAEETEGTEAFQETRAATSHQSFPCHVHGQHEDFWPRLDGAWVCGKCHPPLASGMN